MYEQMSGEGGGALEHFPTHCTAKRPLLKQQALWLWIQECFVHEIILVCTVHFVVIRSFPRKRNAMLTLPLHSDRSDLMCADDRGALLP